MLHRAKLLEQLQQISDALFFDLSPQCAIARKAWSVLVCDSTLSSKVAMQNMPWPLPTWQGPIDKSFPVAPFNKPYQLLCVDGSQIYPDKHQGTSCFLINIGVVTLQYGTGNKGIKLQSTPHVFTDIQQGAEAEGKASIDLVNAKREELELEYGLINAQKLKENSAAPLLFLFDGSLIFWHLASKEQSLKEYFLERYLTLLEEYRRNNLWIAGYISLPKSKDLVNIVRAVLCNFDPRSTQHETISQLTDNALTHFFLAPGERSTVFASKSPICHSYPAALAPHFFYFDVGPEIIRIELPAYLAHDQHVLNTVCGILLDQVQKGSGFPVGLAEAHEQAVVKGPDREFFYHVIDKLSIDRKRSLTQSQKSRKKRAIAV